MIAGGLAVVLFGLAALHLYWGIGGKWPGHDDQSLNERVVGTKRARSPGILSCAAVAAALACASAIVVSGQGRIASGVQSLFVYGGYAVLILVFGLRGVAPYVTRIFDYARGTPFFDLNRRYYGPLCLIVAAALVWTFPPGIDQIYA